MNKVLLVEGNDDLHVISALCKKFKLPQNFVVIDCKGIDNLIEQIPVRLKTDIETIGIIIDTDLNINNRWDTLKTIFRSKNFEVVDNLPVEGLIMDNLQSIKIGVWIMPNNKTNGMLEDFISFLIPEGDDLLPKVDLSLENIENENLNRYSVIHRSKARINTWLAWQEVPGTPMGLSITRRYLTTDESNCVLFIDWLKTLFL